MGTSSGSSGTSKQIVQNQPAPYLEPYIKGAASDAQNLYQSGGPAVFPGSTVANRSPETTDAWGSTAARAIGGSPLTGAAQGWAQGILNGTAPAYGALGDSVWSQVRPQIDSQFSANGRYGSDSHAEAMSRGYTEGLAPSFAALQGQAAGLANPLANQDYTDLGALGAVGSARDAYGQNLVTDAYNRFQQTQQRPYDNLSWYNSQLYGSPYNTQSSKGTAPSTGGFNWGGFLGGVGSALGSAAGSYFGS